MGLHIKESKRAERRHHLQRLKKSRAHYWRRAAGRNKRQLGLVLSAPQHCSGFCCVNPRKHWKELTLQEKRVAASASAMMDEALQLFYEKKSAT